MIMFIYIFALTSITASCTLIGTGAGQDLQVIPSTSFKFFGEKYVSLNVTGSPVVQLEAGDKDTNVICSGYYDKKIQGYAGHVVVIDTDICESYVALYTKLSEMNALAVLLTFGGNDIPGSIVFSHDGSKGLSTRYHPMPFLHLAVRDVPDIVDAIRAGNLVILESTPNPWLAISENFLWLFLMRVLPACMSFATALAAFHGLVRNNGSHQEASWILLNIFSGDMAVRDVVLLIEIASMGVLTVVFGTGNYLTGEFISRRSVRFFFSSFTGVGLFTSTMLMLQLYSVRNRDNPMENASMTKPLKDYGLRKVACIAAHRYGVVRDKQRWWVMWLGKDGNTVSIGVARWCGSCPGS